VWGLYAGLLLTLATTATCWQGEGTDNAKGFFEWLKANEREDDKSRFSPLRFAVFGLGTWCLAPWLPPPALATDNHAPLHNIGMSQTYPARYQAAAKWVEKRMLELGAQEIVERGTSPISWGTLAD
jgi:sulfite reductase alpha subunit-like flavoprotein